MIESLTEACHSFIYNVIRLWIPLHFCFAMKSIFSTFAICVIYGYGKLIFLKVSFFNCSFPFSFHFRKDILAVSSHLHFSYRVNIIKLIIIEFVNNKQFYQIQKMSHIIKIQTISAALY